MCLLLIITQHNARLISIGFPKGLWSRVDHLHCSELFFLGSRSQFRQNYSIQTSVQGAVNRFCCAHLFHSDESLQSSVAPKDGEKLNASLVQRFPKWGLGITKGLGEGSRGQGKLHFTVIALT